MRGFSRSEYRDRCARAQVLMAEFELAALLLTTEPEVRYFTGFLTRFWESPTRPWYVILPASGDPIAVIPSIGKALMQSTWIKDIRSWTSPNLFDDGVTLLAEALCEHVPDGASIGLPDGHETHVRMPKADLIALQTHLGERRIIGDSGIVRRLRMVKSEEEIAKIRTACGIAGQAFDRVPTIAAEAVPLDRIFRQFQMLCLDEGADWVPYLAGGAGQNGYLDVISPATDAPLKTGDVLMLDTGMVYDGYFCDYDRNWSVGPPSTAVATAYNRLIEATDAGALAAKIGATASDVFHAINAVLASGEDCTEAGRLGHGLGMSLTEWPSLIADDHTVLEAGMVLTLEPSIVVDDTGNRLLVHEENILITQNGPEFLSPRAKAEISQI